MTYGEIAEGWATRRWRARSARPWAKTDTDHHACHRVLAAGGKSGGFSASGGVVTKLRLLTIEGAQPGGPTLFDRLPLAARRRRG